MKKSEAIKKDCPFKFSKCTPDSCIAWKNMVINGQFNDDQGYCSVCMGSKL